MTQKLSQWIAHMPCIWTHNPNISTKLVRGVPESFMDGRGAMCSEAFLSHGPNAERPTIWTDLVHYARRLLQAYLGTDAKSHREFSGCIHHFTARDLRKSPSHGPYGGAHLG